MNCTSPTRVKAGLAPHINYNAGQPRDPKTGRMEEWNRGKAIPVPVKGSEQELWWETAIALQDVDNSAPMIGDDNTPGHYDGLAITCQRHTHRRWYRGDDMALNIPSVASMKRMAREHPGQTFQVPVELDVAGRTQIVWCDVTKGGRGMWAVEATTPMGSGRHEVEEGLRSLLEARRPTHVPLEAGALVKEYKKRVLLEGQALTPLPESGTVKWASWQQGVLTVQLPPTRTNPSGVYAYRAPRAIYDAMVGAPSAGAYYNHHIRRQFTHTWTKECRKCHRVYLAKRGHRCPPLPRTAKPVLDGEAELKGQNLRFWLHRQAELSAMGVDEFGQPAR